jgi:hypothetical protein
VRALRSSIITRSRRYGVIASALILPSRATSVVGVIRIAGCGGASACVSAARQLNLARVTKRNVRPGLLRLSVPASNRPLVREIGMPLRKAHMDTLPATFTLSVRLANRTRVGIVQHITLRF